MRAWSDGLVALRSAPLFGIGQGKYEELSGLCAHNSYVEGYTELGFVGGTLFTGAFAYALWTLIRVGRRIRPDQQPTLARLRPYLLSVVVALMVGMVSLSRNYSLPTYLILGLSAAYLRLAAAQLPGAVPPLSAPLVFRWVGLSALFVAVMSIGTPLLVRWH
jgi:hypothetical protein